MDNQLQSARWAIVDVEVGLQDHKIHDIGALRHDGAVYHQASSTKSGTGDCCPVGRLGAVKSIGGAAILPHREIFRSHNLNLYQCVFW